MYGGHQSSECPTREGHRTVSEEYGSAGREALRGRQVRGCGLLCSFLSEGLCGQDAEETALREESALTAGFSHIIYKKSFLINLQFQGGS